MPFSTSTSSGFSPTPLPNMAGDTNPTIIAQPFYRQLDSVAFEFQADTGPAVDRGFFLEFLESDEVFARVFLQNPITDGMYLRGFFGQRVNYGALTLGSDRWEQTSLPVGFWIEPNVSVRLRCENGASTDQWVNVVFMMSYPEKEVPKELRG